ncbi:hypothetical protein D3C87_125390 [compost metagenome]
MSTEERWLKICEDVLRLFAESRGGVGPQPEENCLHEPKMNQVRVKHFRGDEHLCTEVVGEPFYYMECQHCGIKIKAEKWVSA